MSKKRKESRKKSTDWQKTLSRVFIVVILFACVIGFSLSTSFFSIFKTAEAGSFAIVDYTLFYEEGLPIISSDQYLVQEAVNQGIPVAYTNPLLIEVGNIQSKKITPIDVYLYPEGVVKYALFDLEIDTISSEVEGMHQNDIKKIDLEFAPTLIQNMSAETFNEAGANFSQAMVGMMMPLTFLYSEEGSYSENKSALSRPSLIIGKTNDTVTMRYGYALAEIKVRELK